VNARVTALAGTHARLDELIALRYQPLPEGRLQRASGAPGGARLSRLKGRGIDFAEVRLYQPGDDVRSIDWRVTARKARPHTKVYREERERPTLIVLDQTRTMFFGSRRRMKSVAAAEVAARLAWHALERGDRVGGIVVEDKTEHVLRPHRSPRAVLRLLNRIATSNARLDRTLPRTDEGPMERALEHLVRIARTGHRIHLIGDFEHLSTRAEQLLKRLARHNGVAAIVVNDPLERSLPPADAYLVTDGVSRLRLDSASRAARNDYASRFAARRRAFASLCRGAQIELIELMTDEDAFDRLKRRLQY
jgi:uncharacterized protein (DUF58 family)